MKRYIVIAALLLVSGTALAHYHVWQKVGQRDGNNGQVICDWSCYGPTGSHMTSTSGYGYCPHP